MKLIPASRAFAMMRAEVASSVGPPNIMVPRQIGETFRPLRPSWRYCIFGRPSREAASITACSRHCERSEAIHASACGPMDCFVAEPVIGPAQEGRPRWLLAMTVGASMPHDFRHLLRRRGIAAALGAD